MGESSEIQRNGQVSHDSSKAKKINNLLNNPKTRLEGLQMLDLFLGDCPDGDFIQFCISWMQNCCKIDGSMKNRDVSIRLLETLFKISSNYQELKKSVSFFITTRYFDFFFKYFSNSQIGWSCTKTCLSFYRGACGPFQESVEKVLRNEIEKKVRISSTLASCFALIPCLGGGGNEGLIYRKNWRAQFVKFLSDSHSILNALFVDVEELQEYKTPKNTNSGLSSEKDIDALVTQLFNYTAVLNSMLLNEYPAPKCIPSDQVFELICRGLALNPKALSKRLTTPVISLQKVLPEVHQIFFSLLKAIIVTCKNQLLPYSHLICKLIKQNLEWSVWESSQGSENPFGSYRVAIYETFCNWLAVARNGSCIETIAGVVVSNAVGDIESKSAAVFLKEAKAQNHPKRREKTTRRINSSGNSRLCYAAIKALQFLLKFVGVLLKPEEHKFLQEFVVKMLGEIQKSSTFDLVVPFSVPSCRLELYSLLLDLVHHPCSKWPPPTNFALRLFINGINDSFPEISAFCSSAVNLLTVIIHPQYDNGGFISSEVPDRPRTEIEWREEPMETDHEKETEPFVEETDGRQESSDLEEKISDVDGVSSVSSDDDSGRVVTFLKDTLEPKSKLREKSPKKSSQISLDDEPQNKIQKETESKGLERTGESSPSSSDDEPQSKMQKLTETKELEKTPQKSPNSSGDEPMNEIQEAIEMREQDKTPSPKKGKLKESPEKSPKAESTNNMTPESTNEDGQHKTRYFLRSKRKGSSEEPDESVKKTSSPESVKKTSSPESSKSTPGKSLSAFLNEKKRPRTRALSKAELSSETESKTDDVDANINDDEDIKASFDDSFID